MKGLGNKISVIAVIIILLCVSGIIITGFLISREIKTAAYKLNGTGHSVKIVHISDLHYPKNKHTLDGVYQRAKALAPDIIALTGDIADGSATQADLTEICEFIEELTSICTVYFVLGNHEIGLPSLDTFLQKLQSSGAKLLNNEVDITSFGGKNIAVIGLSDGKKLNVKNVPGLNKKDACAYSVLLAHRPELMDNYAENNINLALTGHTHGGGARIFNKGIYAPNQGLFPKYSHGKYQKNETVMIVNAGLSGGRFFNPPEIGLITVSI